MIINTIRLKKVWVLISNSSLILEALKKDLKKSVGFDFYLVFNFRSTEKSFKKSVGFDFYLVFNFRSTEKSFKSDFFVYLNYTMSKVKPEISNCDLFKKY